MSFSRLADLVKFIRLFIGFSIKLITLLNKPRKSLKKNMC